MGFLGIHIAGWLLVLIFAVSLFSSSTLFKNMFFKTGTGPLKKLLANTYVALICVLTLTFFYFGGKTAPFNKTPKIYKDLQKYVTDENMKPDRDAQKALAFCGAGNIYRCLCGIEGAKDLKPKHKSSMRKAIVKAMEEQQKSERFLE